MPSREQSKDARRGRTEEGDRMLVLPDDVRLLRPTDDPAEDAFGVGGVGRVDGAVYVGLDLVGGHAVRE